MALKLKVKHSGGSRKIYDRKPKLDDAGNPIEGEYIEVIHSLSVDAYELKKEPKLDGEGKEMKDAYDRVIMTETVIGKPFEVNDEEYVLSRHGQILEKA